MCWTEPCNWLRRCTEYSGEEFSEFSPFKFILSLFNTLCVWRIANSTCDSNHGLWTSCTFFNALADLSDLRRRKILQFCVWVFIMDIKLQEMINQGEKLSMLHCDMTEAELHKQTEQRSDASKCKFHNFTPTVKPITFNESWNWNNCFYHITEEVIFYY